MKLKKQSETPTVPLLALMCLAVLFMLLPQAQAQVTPGTQITLTNLPLFITGGSTSNLAAQPIALRQGGGFGVAVSALGTNALTTGNLTLTWNVSRDGTSTNFTTTGPITTTVACNGTSTAWYWTNYSVAALNNNPWLTLSSIANGNATNSVTNLAVTVFFGNPSYNYGQ
jgi:hypothetical protein